MKLPIIIGASITGVAALILAIALFNAMREANVAATNNLPGQTQPGQGNQGNPPAKDKPPGPDKGPGQDKGPPSIEAQVLEKYGRLSYANESSNLFACGWFAKNRPPNKELQAKVANKLMDIIENGDGIAFGAAAEAMPYWATPEIGGRLLVKVRAGVAQYYISAGRNMRRPFRPSFATSRPTSRAK